MWVWFDRLGGLVLDAGVSALALWALAALAMLGCRQPARRLKLARAAVVGSLALWPLAGLGPLPRFHLIGAARGAGLVPGPHLPPRWRSSAPQRTAPARPAGQGGGPADRTPTAGGWPARVLTLAYLSGVGCGLAWLGLGCAALGWVTRRSVPPSPGAAALYQSLPYPGGRRRPRLRTSDRVRRPALVGAFRPMILIPPDLDRPGSVDRLRLSLLHELAHAETADPWYGLLGRAAQALWFFAPPLWWVASQMRIDQEFLADRRAAAGFGPVGDYAASLLEFAADRVAPPGPTAAGGGARGPGSPLFQRVLMLLRCPFPVEPSPPVGWSWGIPCLALLVTLGASSLSIRPPVAGPVGPTAATRFRLTGLEIPAAPPGPQGRAPVFELPVRLPETFDLSVEVWGDLLTLSRTRLAGLPLAVPAPSPPPESAPANWHRVRVRRDFEGVTLWLDGRRSERHQGPAPTLAGWLSVEPAPGRPASLQGLILSW